MAARTFSSPSSEISSAIMGDMASSAASRNRQPETRLRVSVLFQLEAKLSQDGDGCAHLFVAKLRDQLGDHR